MTTAVVEPDAKAGTEWRESIARAVHVLGHLDSWLTKPPEATSLDDLLAIKGQVDPAAATPGALLVRTLALVPLLFKQRGGQDHSVLGRPSSDDSSTARRWASSVAGEQKRDEIEELVGGFLEKIDREILRQLDDGTEDERLIRSSDFVGLRGNGLVILDRGDGVQLEVGLVKCLPDGHPLREWPSEFLYEYDFHPAIILGPPSPAAFGGPGIARPFYLTAFSEQITRSLRLRQLRERKDQNPHLTADEYRTIVETLKQVETKLPPKPTSGTPEAPVPKPTSWREKTLLAFEVLQRPHVVFVPPAEGTSINDLLAVRDLLGVREDERSPGRDAARRWAARAVGQTRKDELIDILHPLLNAIDRAAVLEIDRAITWACHQSTRPTKRERRP